MKKLSMIVLCSLALLLLSLPVMAQDDAGDDGNIGIVTTRAAAPDPDQFRLVQVATGLQVPLYATGAGDDSGRLFVLEQSGRIWVFQDDVQQATPFLDLSGTVSQDVLSGYSERGLLGLAFHPQFADNGYFFVNYTDRAGTTQVVRFTVSSDDPNVADLTSAFPLFSLEQPYVNHNGGHMEFGPDGYLYISAGDGGSADDPFNNGQNPSTLLGTILRIDVDSTTDDLAYGIPEDNPYINDSRLAPEVWAYGLRNVWRFSFDRATGDAYYADVGQNAWEEVNFQPADSSGGENYGWNAFEGLTAYIGGAPSDVVMPVAVYNHSLGCSITGGYVYRGQAIADLQGAYLYSDYCQGRLWALWKTEAGEWQDAEIMGLERNISSFGQDDNGELYIIDYRNGILFRFEPAA
ncbi:MAG: PQQ-dependent sugar dehydrogenase [Aggregatilineales bacterium]